MVDVVWRNKEATMTHKKCYLRGVVGMMKRYLKRRMSAGLLVRAGQEQVMRFQLYKTHEFNETLATEFVLLAFSNLQSLQVLLFIFILLALISCVVGNSTILFLVTHERSLHMPMYFFISNFAVLEIVFVSITVPKLLANLLEASRTISFIGCFAQLYAFNSLGVGECYLLAIMAFDRDLAINNPLRYSSIMNKSLCIELAAAPWVIGFVIAAIPTIFTAQLKFCGSNKVNHFFCDLAPMQNIACSNPVVSYLVTSSTAVFATVVPFLIILGFYIHIIATISKIKSTVGKQKAFSTCSSHLIVACLFYCSAIVVYVRPKGSQHDKFLALIYTVIIPLLNPFIYTLRNKDVKAALRKSQVLRVLGQIRISHVEQDHC
ncbi:olfactory receptor 5V1-like [Hyla sarda]|uniref:olfactory receptor 5V1-like n=1 Tax=Hyla sarda TaxID=327740 RepID=UPI0024C2A90D|nr:olfactory receptor 5V1-like [Hyla sarda]